MRLDLIENRNKRVGQLSRNKFGSLMEIIEYNGSGDVTIKFPEYGYITKGIWRNFVEGRIRNVYDRSVCGVGYIGEGDYRPKNLESKKDSIQYVTWHSMIHRCYDDNYIKRQPTYAGCTVAEEWHNFQNFARWYDDNYYDVEGERVALDKDILIKGNKRYSPEACIFVPQRINSLFIKNNARRGNLPVGVHYVRKPNKFVASCQIGTKTVVLGRYKDVEDAFLAYKDYKEKTIKEFANAYKDKIPKKVYQALYSYEVGIND